MLSLKQNLLINGGCLVIGALSSFYIVKSKTELKIVNEKTVEYVDKEVIKYVDKVVTKTEYVDRVVVKKVTETRLPDGTRTKVTEVENVDKSVKSKDSEVKVSTKSTETTLKENTIQTTIQSYSIPRYGIGVDYRLNKELSYGHKDFGLLLEYRPIEKLPVYLTLHSYDFFSEFAVGFKISF